MNKLTILLLFAIPACSLPQVGQCEQDNDENKLVMFSLADQEGGEFEGSFSWVDNEKTFTLSADGRLESSSQTAPHEVKLPVDKNAYVNQVRHLTYSDAIYLLYSVSDSDAAWGHLCKISHGLTINWCHDVSGIYLHGAMGKKRLYVSGMGIKSMLDPGSGKVIWKIRDTNTKYTDVCPRSENVSSVVFYMVEALPNRPVMVVTLNKNNGALIKTETAQLEYPCQ